MAVETDPAAVELAARFGVEPQSEFVGLQAGAVEAVEQRPLDPVADGLEAADHALLELGQLGLYAVGAFALDY